MSTPSPNSPEAILRLSASLRLLAMDLVRDPAEAEDLVQQAWVAMLESPRERIHDLRRWMRAVVRHGASRERRRDRERRDREVLVARSELDSEESAAEWRSSAHMLIDAVAELEEPYRKVVHARYFEGRSVVEVAAALDVPTGTVKTWTRRGVQRLRENLTRSSGGEREVWALALLPLTMLQATDPKPAASGAEPMLAFAGLTVAVAAVVLGVFILFRGDAPEEVAVSDLEGNPAVPSEESLPAGPSEAEARVALAEPELEIPSTPDTEPVLPPAKQELRVSVVDASGRAFPGATVMLHGDEVTEIARGETDAQGEVELEVELAALTSIPGIEARHPIVQVNAFAPGLASSDSFYVALPPGEQVEVRVELAAQGRAFAALLEDEYGDPVEGAIVRAMRLSRDFDVLADRTRVGTYQPITWSDAEGGFALEHLEFTTTSLEVRAVDFLPLRIALPPPGDEASEERRYTLDRGGAVFGQLRYADGRPAADALVRLLFLPRRHGAETYTTADEDGNYALRGIPPALCLVFANAPDEPELWAGTRVHGGRSPETEWSATLERRDGVTVRVIDATGEPLPLKNVLMGVELEGALWIDGATTGEDGRAHFLHVPDSVFQVRVIDRDAAGTQRAIALASNIRPSADEHVIRVAAALEPKPAALVVLARLSAGAPAQGARLLTYNHASTAENRAAADPTSGRLEIAALEPGRYTVRVLFPNIGIVELGDLDLQSGQQLDLGFVEPPERMEVEFVAPDGVEAEASELELVAVYRAGDVLHRHQVALVEIASGLSMWLAPGDYELCALGGKGEPLRSFRVEGSQPQRIELDAERDR